jgi:hypothetical protein
MLRPMICELIGYGPSEYWQTFGATRNYAATASSPWQATSVYISYKTALKAVSPLSTPLMRQMICHASHHADHGSRWIHPLHPLSPPRTLEISYFNVHSTLINRLNTHEIRVARCEFEVKISGSGKMYASGRCRNP